MFELNIAWKHIISNPKIAVFSILSVALAVGIIVVMMGMMEGYREEIVKTTVENDPHITIESKKDEDYIHLYRTLVGQIENNPQVVAVSPRLIGKAGAKCRDKISGAEIIGIDPLKEDALMKVQEDLLWGDCHDLITKKHTALVGWKLAKDLKLKPEDDIILTHRNSSLRVKPAGFIRTGTGSDSSLVYLPLSTAQDLFQQGDVVSQIGVRLIDIYTASPIVRDIQTRTSYRAQSWQDKSRDVLNLLETQKRIMNLVYLLIFIIAGFGVANGMIMNVSRRTKEIGILMAMGSSQTAIVKIFMAESLILGPPSALLGCILAYVVAKSIEVYPIQLPSDIYAVSKMTVLLTPEITACAVLFALSISFLAGIYPAYRASRLDPVKAIAAN